MDSVYENLTDEQKEKAKQCKTMDELMALAGEWGIELPDEALDSIAGGGCAEKHKIKQQCPKCHSLDVKTVPPHDNVFECMKCGHVWKITIPPL